MTARTIRMTPMTVAVFISTSRKTGWVSRGSPRSFLHLHSLGSQVLAALCPAHQSADERHEEQDDENEEQDLGDSRRSCRNPEKSEHCCNDRYDEEYHSPTQHRASYRGNYPSQSLNARHAPLTQPF